MTEPPRMVFFAVYLADGRIVRAGVCARHELPYQAINAGELLLETEQLITSPNMWRYDSDLGKAVLAIQ